MSPRPWLRLLPLCLALAACGDEKDDSGGGDSDADADADTDVDTDTDADACEGTNVLDQGSRICWNRCPLGTTWVPPDKDPGRCEGTPTTMHHEEATTACGELGPDWRLPGYGNLIALIGPCDKVAISGEAGQCAACTDACKAKVIADPCSQLFGRDANTYWAETPYAGAKGEYMAADFCTGLTAHFPDDPSPETIAVRCMRPPPPPG